MQRKFNAYLWDALHAGNEILEFTAGKSALDYSQGNLLRSAVERKFGIIGEALAQARRHFPDQIEQIGDCSPVIGFRNQLIHNYNSIDDDEVWLIIQQSLPKLLNQIASVLDQTPPPEA